MGVKSQIDVEKALRDLYEQADCLPPLWRVLYQEGMRANHLLFSKEDVEGFRAPKSKNILSESEQSAVCEAAARLFVCGDIASMRRLVSELSQPSRSYLFGLYLRHLQKLRLYVANALH